jgi:hypothetical protein
MEIWKDVKGYEGIYQVSNLGNVKRLPYSQTMTWLKTECERHYNGNVLTPSKKDGKYQVVQLSKDGKSKQFYVHRIVASAFIGEIPRGLSVNHIDKDIDNNRSDNLEIVTYRDNTIHANKPKKQTSKYVGVYWNKARQKWVAMVRLPKGKKNYLGGFENEDEAYKAVLNEYKRQGLNLKYA